MLQIDVDENGAVQYSFVSEQQPRNGHDTSLAVTAEQHSESDANNSATATVESKECKKAEKECGMKTVGKGIKLRLQGKVAGPTLEQMEKKYQLKSLH
jgi:hypothetical protein